MHVIISEKLYDADYVANATLGFEELRKRAAEYTPERVAKWTGIPAEDIVRLAREYATTRPAAIRLNYGIQRVQNGGMATRAVAMLPCLVGSWKDVGGGLQMSLSGAFPHDKEALRRADLMQESLGRPARTINMVELGKALTEAGDPPVQALFVYHSNPAAVCPDQNKVIRGLKRDDLFTVVHEQFLTDTTDYADIVLPATTFFENKDLQAAYGHYYLQISNQAIEPLGECRSNVDMFRALSQRMGFTDACFRESVDEMIDAALAKDHPWLEGITRERLECEGHIRLKLPKSNSDSNGYFLPFAEGNFPTASGKAEFYSANMAAQGLDPVVSFVPPSESRNAEFREYPLELLARKADNFLNSSFCNHPGHRSLEHGRMGVLEMSAADATPRGIGEGDSVDVFNQRGTMQMVARIDETVRPGLVCARLDWARLSNGGVNVNVLTSDRLTDMGAGATFYSTLVEVRRAKS
jgi:anaerobic selenocysteine-containing dehydrogenase